MMRPSEAFQTETEELRDLGFGVAFSVVVARGRAGRGAKVPVRFASVTI